MPLLTTGKSFIRAVEDAGAVAVYAPLEGGFEGRYQRRLRAKGYLTQTITARGLGNPAAYLMGVHGVRPAHLGKKTIGQSAMVGLRYFVPPMAAYDLESIPAEFKGLVLWILEGSILSRQELAYLVDLPQQEPRIKIAIEMGGERYFRWQPLRELLAD